MPPQYSGTTNPEDPTFSHSRTAEWFATLGMESVQAMNESESSPANLREMWLDAIVDVAIVLTSKEVVPLGYDKVGESWGIALVSREIRCLE